MYVNTPDSTLLRGTNVIRFPAMVFFSIKKEPSYTPRVRLPNSFKFCFKFAEIFQIKSPLLQCPALPRIRSCRVPPLPRSCPENRLYLMEGGNRNRAEWGSDVGGWTLVSSERTSREKGRNKREHGLHIKMQQASANRQCRLMFGRNLFKNAGHQCTVRRSRETCHGGSSQNVLKFVKKHKGLRRRK